MRVNKSFYLCKIFALFFPKREIGFVENVLRILTLTFVLCFFFLEFCTFQQNPAKHIIFKLFLLFLFMGLFDVFRKKEEKKIELEVVSTEQGDYQDFKERLERSSLIMLIIGKRGSGKTALGFSLLEMLAGKRKAYYIRKAKLPWWIHQVDSIDKIKNNSLVLVDEAALSFSARESMSKSNKFLGKLMAIARHKNLTLILITQNSAMLDLNILRLADTLLFKEPSLLQARFERKAIGDLFKKVESAFHVLKDKEKKKYAYVIDDEFEGTLSFPLPGFWSDSLSKSYSDAEV